MATHTVRSVISDIASVLAMMVVFVIFAATVLVVTFGFLWVVVEVLGVQLPPVTVFVAFVVAIAFIEIVTDAVINLKD